ncbi:MAG TPA: hypothetical protein VFY91_11545 [Microbacterium sp.]|nr:hypothetical protein [Microbacterium sp.]
MLKKSIAVGVLTVGLVLGSAGAASAHECFIPNRSEQGNAGSTHSKNWVALEISELFASGHVFFGGPALTPAQVEQAVAMAADAGIPTTLTTFARDTLPKGKGAPESHSTDGKGIDHYFHLYEADLFAIFQEVQPG